MFWNLYIYTVYIVDSGEELKDVEGAPLLQCHELFPDVHHR